MKVDLVVPTIRRLNFLTDWEGEFNQCHVIVVEDTSGGNRKYNERILNDLGLDYSYYTHVEIDEELGDEKWIIPRRTDCVKSYGFLKAYQDRADVIISLDDDCYNLRNNFVKTHVQMLRPRFVSDKWFNPLNTFGVEEVFTRGFPYDIRCKRDVVLNQSLWTTQPDLDGQTKLRNNIKLQEKDFGHSIVVPKGMFTTICTMNIAFRRKIVPAYYQLLMNLETYGLDRFGDIWSGVFLKKIVDHLDDAISLGQPLVDHRQAYRDPKIDIEKEKNGLGLNEVIWKEIYKIELTERTYYDCYLELTEKLDIDKPYFKLLKRAMKCWSKLF